MTPQERRFWLAAERTAASVGPEMRAALLALVRSMRDRLSDAEMERLIRAGRVEDLVRGMLVAIEAEARVRPVRDAIRTAYQRSAETTIATLPFPRAVTVDVAFNLLSPRVVAAIETLESRALTAIGEEAAATVRQVVQRGIVEGVGPRALIPQLRASIGLAPNQEAAVRAYADALRSGDFAKARGYALRDKRSDVLLRRLAKERGALTEAQVERMTASYRKGWQAFNAETQSRTAMLDASRAGQREAYEAAIESGGLDRSRAMKRWVTTLDGRQRASHDAMHGVEVQMDQLFPVDGGVQVPGENAYNCRCVCLYRLKPRTA